MFCGNILIYITTCCSVYSVLHSTLYAFEWRMQGDDSTIGAVMRTNICSTFANESIILRTRVQCDFRWLCVRIYVCRNSWAALYVGYEAIYVECYLLSDVCDSFLIKSKIFLERCNQFWKIKKYPENWNYLILNGNISRRSCFTVTDHDHEL